MEEAESLYDADGSDLRVVEKRWGLWDAGKPFLRFPSLGHMYSMASQYIFGGWEHAGKTMGLAPFGDAARFPDPIVDCTDDGMTLDTAWITKLPSARRTRRPWTTCAGTWPRRCRPSWSAASRTSATCSTARPGATACA